MIESNNDLEQLRIHELRDLARKMGVHSPTTLKKEQIIEEIEKILNGDIEPYVNTTRQGRPPRNQEDTFNVIDFLLPNDDKNCIDYPTQNEKFSFAVNMSPAQYIDLKQTNVSNEISGYVDIMDAGYGIVRNLNYFPSNADVFLSSHFITNYDIKKGDFVRGLARRIKEDKPQVVVTLDKTLNKHCFDFDNTKADCLKEKFVVDTKLISNNIFKGGRYFIECKDKKAIYNQGYEIAKTIKENNKGLLVKLVYLNAVPELVPYVNCDIEIFDVPFNKNSEEVAIGFNLFIEKCKRDVENNQQVVVVICGLHHLAKAYNMLANGSANFNEINPLTIYKLKNLLFNAKNINEKSSFTLIDLDTLDLPQGLSDIYKYELSELFTS